MNKLGVVIASLIFLFGLFSLPLVPKYWNFEAKIESYWVVSGNESSVIYYAPHMAAGAVLTLSLIFMASSALYIYWEVKGN